MEMEIDYHAIGNRIRRYRLERGFSQEVVSERADLTPAHYSHIERGNTKPSLPTLIRVANVFGVSIDDLLCDNLSKSIHVRIKDIDELLADCSSSEIKALVEILAASKKALREVEKIRMRASERPQFIHGPSLTFYGTVLTFR